MTRSEIETLFKTYYAKMYRVARAIIYDEDAAKDVVSDVFETIINNQTVLQADTTEHYLMSS
ncbi:MAG: RNA polymerase, partial [Bacteroidales bacterium]|nr:RNA polymerase [Bacteroidales bacterium]